MFTGIIDHVGQITQVTSMQGGMKLRIKTKFNSLTLGESIAINGICLTVTTLGDSAFECELSPETLSLTTARSFHEDTHVNLERAMQAQGSFGGHFVLGHVDTTASVSKIEQEGEFYRYEFSDLPTEAQPYLLTKGSIAVNGVSLTINEVAQQGFAVMLIPHTLQHTQLDELKVGDRVNIEYDYLARIVAARLTHVENSVV